MDRPQEGGKNRRAASQVVSEVILIAVTLIAAVALAGSVFGLMGTYSRTAQVTATTVSCTAVAPAVCRVSLANIGTTNVRTVSCGVDANAAVQTGVNGGVAAANIPAGGTHAQATCTLAAGGGAMDSPASGYFSLSNGAQIYFSGTWQ